MSEQDDIVVGASGQESGGRRGDEGYLSGEEKEALVESGSDLAPYKDLKFRVPDEDDERPPSKEVEALGLTTSTLKDAGEEITRLRSQAEGRELADGVVELLDVAEEVAEDLDYEEAEEFRQNAEIQALQHAAAIEDEELRQRTFAKLEERVDEDLYEQFVDEWQRQYVEQTERDVQAGWEQAQAEMDKQAETFAAVVQLESDLLAQMSPLEQHLATQLLDAARDDIAQMDPASAQQAVRTRMEMSRVQAAKIEEAHTQAEIIKAHGRTKIPGWSGRDLREADVQMLGLMPELTPTVEEVHEAHERAQKGTRIDRQAAKRIHRGSGPTGIEKLQAQSIALAKAMGVPVHDAATGRRLG